MASATPPFASAVGHEAELDLRATLRAYNDALNVGSTAAVMSLYTEDGVFMAPFSDSAVGLGAISAAYDRVFAELSFAVTFTVDEVQILSPVFALVRTHSAGTIGHASTGKTTAEANQELFVLRRDEGRDWRIARYSFSPISAPAGA